MNNNKDEKFLVLRGISEKLGRNYERAYGVSAYSKTEEFYPDNLKIRQFLRTTTHCIRTEDVQEYKTMFAVNELNFKRLVNFFGKYYIKDSFYISRNDSVMNMLNKKFVIDECDNESDD